MRILQRLCYLSLAASLAAGSRKWNNTGVGSIIFEEAWTPPEFASSDGYVRYALPTLT